MTLVLLSLRGIAAILVLTTLVGGIPRVVQLALAVTLGLWSGFIVMASPGIGAPALDLATALHELAIGAALGIVGALPLLVAATAGRLVDLAAAGRAQGTYSTFFGVLSAAVFVGVDGHVAVLRAIVESHASIPSLATAEAGVLAMLAKLVPVAVRLASPWLVTAAVVQIAVGVGMRVAGRAGPHVAVGAAVPAALVMITAALVSTLAVAIAALVRATLG